MPGNKNDHEMKMAQVGDLEQGVLVKHAKLEGVTPEGLQAAFEAFGALDMSAGKTMFRDYSYHHTALIYFEEEVGVQAALAKGFVNVGGNELTFTQLKVLPRREPRQRGSGRQSAPEENSVYAAGLPADVEKAEIEEAFSKFGTVTSVAIRKRRDGTGDPYAFIGFDSKDSVEATIAAAENGDISGLIDGADLTVERRNVREVSAATGNGASSNKNASSRTRRNDAAADREAPKAPRGVHVARFATGATEESLASAFGQFGKVARVRLVNRHGSASVEYSEVAQMEAANAAASGSVSLGGADYMVEPSRRRPGGRQRDEESSDPITSLHVAGFPPSYGNYTEDDLKAAFAALGPPGDIVRVSIRPPNRHATIIYEDATDAARLVADAPASIDGVELAAGEAKLLIEMSRGSRRRNKGGRRRNGRRGEQQR